KENGLWVMSTVKTDFFAVRGAVYRVTGARGKVDMESKNLIISGNVIMISSNGYTFKTDEIVYNSEKKVLTSSTQVKVVGPKEPHSRQRLQLVGDTLESSLEESYMWINGNVKTSKVLQDGRLAKISSASARLSGVNNSVEFSEEVEIDVDGVKVTGPAAVFKYSQQGEILDSVVVKGGARLSDARRWATADRVDVSLKEDKVVFRGNPRLVHGGDELRGEEIIFTKGGKRVQVVKARAKVVDPQGRKE
ncbi:MAG: LPS export ABC transporter periplasmic protein LptC, partial [Bdellovibrionales bacterium]|nr:LPS export ABC transporter periplasmic protein LptC [Bdellovibrionales bacterium]